MGVVIPRVWGSGTACLLLLDSGNVEGGTLYRCSYAARNSRGGGIVFLGLSAAPLVVDFLGLSATPLVVDFHGLSAAPVVAEEEYGDRALLVCCCSTAEMLGLCREEFEGIAFLGLSDIAYIYSSITFSFNTQQYSFCGGEIISIWFYSHHSVLLCIT
jgi:hypothetical protein